MCLLLKGSLSAVIGVGLRVHNTLSHSLPPLARAPFSIIFCEAVAIYGIIMAIVFGNTLKVCVRACVCACVRACVCACVCACVSVPV